MYDTYDVAPYTVRCAIYRYDHTKKLKHKFENKREKHNKIDDLLIFHC